MWCTIGKVITFIAACCHKPQKKCPTSNSCKHLLSSSVWCTLGDHLQHIEPDCLWQRPETKHRKTYRSKPTKTHLRTSYFMLLNQQKNKIIMDMKKLQKKFKSLCTMRSLLLSNSLLVPYNFVRSVWGLVFSTDCYVKLFERKKSQEATKLTALSTSWNQGLIWSPSPIHETQFYAQGSQNAQ